MKLLDETMQAALLGFDDRGTPLRRHFFPFSIPSHKLSREPGLMIYTVRIKVHLAMTAREALAEKLGRPVLGFMMLVEVGSDEEKVDYGLIDIMDIPEDQVVFQPQERAHEQEPERH